MRQVIENVESTRRQYALRGRATALGWRDEQIVVVDDDQGESGASASWREGFQRLVSDVGLGRAGIVMGLEVSRPARNNADWHRLLEICALADTLILDEGGVYDPASFNDRLLLGFKGTMSEAELHVIKARLRGGILNKVRRGEFRCPLPTGFVYDEVGEVAFDPDSAGQGRIGPARPHRQARLQRSGLSLRTAGVEPATQALQSMGPTCRPGGCVPQDTRFKMHASSGRRCNMKSNGPWKHHSNPRRRRRNQKGRGLCLPARCGALYLKLG